MPLFRPIPKSFLLHSIKYQPPIDEGDGGFQESNNQTEVLIENVRFADEKRKVLQSNGTESFTTGVIYIDKVNSKPFIDIDDKGTIIFKNRTLKIVNVKTLETLVGQGTHHLEVEVQ